MGLSRRFLFATNRADQMRPHARNHALSLTKSWGAAICAAMIATRIPTCAAAAAFRPRWASAFDRHVARHRGRGLRGAFLPKFDAVSGFPGSTCCGEDQDMTKPAKIGVLGASGYTGSECVRLLLRHPQVEIALLTADRKAGQEMREVFRAVLALRAAEARPARRARLAGARPRPRVLRAAPCDHPEGHQAAVRTRRRA